MDALEEIDGIAALQEPVRRALYRYVVQEGREVTRDEAAEALEISRGLAAFHLDKLAEEELLAVSYRRLTGRSGPGAGRPSKLYRRSLRQFDITLPPRSYELAARLFARALDGSSGTPPPSLQEVARGFGRNLGLEARERAGENAAAGALLDAMQVVLEGYGFEPRRDPDGRIRLRNCPFHALSAEYRTLVCGMNLSIMDGVVEGLGASGVEAALEPWPGMCCVVFSAA